MHKRSLINFLAIFFILPFSAGGHAERVFKEWIVDFSADSYASAYTTNAADALFGQYCYYENETCVYLTAMHLTCEEDDTIPVLLNTSVGTMSVELVCGPTISHDSNVMYITPFDDVNKLVIKSTYVALAVPKTGGGFEILRFSMMGSSKALEVMRSGTQLIIEAREKASKPRSKKAGMGV